VQYYSVFKLLEPVKKIKIYNIKNSAEFYLIAQTANQGTVSPTHFHVITSDDTVMNPERLQGYTNRLTHLYFNWPVNLNFIF
jgi:hypothetical protein